MPPSRRLVAGGPPQAAASGEKIALQIVFPIPVNLEITNESQSHVVRTLIASPALGVAHRAALIAEIESIQAEGGYLRPPANYVLDLQQSRVVMSQASAQQISYWEPLFQRLLAWRDAL